MAQQETGGRPPERRYDETTDPRNPPRAVTNPRVRSKALAVYLGGIVALFLLVGLALLVWPGTGRDLARVETDDTHAIGTSGERLPGGFAPGGQPRSTDAELERRGVSDGIAGTMPPLTTAPAVTSVRDFEEEPIASLVGRRVELEAVEVEGQEGDSFWVRDGDARVRVMRPGVSVGRGTRVDIGGTALQDVDGAVLIQATRVDVRAQS
jgi:hypothetical protein